MTINIAVGTGSFAIENKEPLHIFEQYDVKLIRNTIGRRLNEEETIEILKDVDGLIAGLEPLNRTVLESAPNLKAISRIGIGLDNVDLIAAKELGIKVSNTPDPPTEAVAEVTIGAILALCRKICEVNTDMHKGVWKKTLGTGLKGTQIFIIGFGRNGRKVAELLNAFGAKIFVYDQYIDVNNLPQYVKPINLEEGLKIADIITLHASGQDEILTVNEFTMMKQGVYLINSARGELVNDAALIRALDDGTIAGAWIDVFREEPYSGPLLNYDQVLLSPHNATFTKQCRKSMEMEAVDNLLKDLSLRE